MLHHPISTEDAYASWITRLILHLDDENLEKYGEEQLGEFLTEWAVVREVTTGTQNKRFAPSSLTNQKSSVSGSQSIDTGIACGFRLKFKNRQACNPSRQQCL
jgi:hypothetical protein